MTVDLISSESDSEESESEPGSDSPDSCESSDSEVVENWMILGHGKQAGDKSISLNLVGGSDSSSGLSFVSLWLLFVLGGLCILPSFMFFMHLNVCVTRRIGIEHFMVQLIQNT